MTLRRATANVLTAPTPAGLWELRSGLFEAGVPAETSMRLLSALLGLLFQVLVLHHLSPYLGGSP